MRSRRMDARRALPPLLALALALVATGALVIVALIGGRTGTIGRDEAALVPAPPARSPSAPITLPAPGSPARGADDSVLAGPEPIPAAPILGVIPPALSSTPTVLPPVLPAGDIPSASAQPEIPALQDGVPATPARPPAHARADASRARDSSAAHSKRGASNGKRVRSGGPKARGKASSKARPATRANVRSEASKQAPKPKSKSSGRAKNPGKNRGKKR